jgi:hypothetical protein
MNGAISWLVELPSQNKCPTLLKTGFQRELGMKY